MTRFARLPARLATLAAEQRNTPDSTAIPFLPDLAVTCQLLPPTVNHMYAHDGTGGRFLTQEAKDFKIGIGWAARAAASAAGWQYVKGVPLALSLFLQFSSRQRQDADNRLKAASDALASALHFDDRVIVAFHVYNVATVPGRPACRLVLTDARLEESYQRAAAAALGMEGIA